MTFLTPVKNYFQSQYINFYYFVTIIKRHTVFYRWPSLIVPLCSNRHGYRVRPRQLHRIGPTVTRCDGEIILSAIVTKLIFEPKLIFGIFFGDEIGNFWSSWHYSSAKLKHGSHYLSTRSRTIKDRTWFKTVEGKTQAHLSTAAVPSWNSAVITWAQALKDRL